LTEYFKDLSFKQKNRYLAVGAGIFVILAYLLAISHTVEAFNQRKMLEAKLTNAKNSPQQITVMESKLAFINSKVNSYIVDSTKGHEQILETVSNFCQKNNLTLREFPKTSYDEQKDITIESNLIIAEGSFINLLKLVYELEHRNKTGKVSSISFFSSMDNKYKRLILSVNIYIQNIRIKNKNGEKN